MRISIVATVVMVGCTWHVDGVDVGGGTGEDGGAIPVAGGGDLGVGGGGGDLASPGGVPDFGTPPVAPCYSEDFSPGNSLADLSASYTTPAWKQTALTALDRRSAGSHALMATMQNDSQLAGLVDPSSFAALMSSLMTACNGETSIYDYGHATPTTFALWMRADLIAQPAIAPTFPRSEIAAYITDDATKSYDGALRGQEGQRDLTAVADDVTSYTNGLACVTAVADAVQDGTSARDGAAASLYYLELYLRRARTAHASIYATLKASADWQRVVRYAWARAAFWRKQATSPKLGVADAPIWAHVDDVANSSEIELFTGAKLSDIECHP